MNEEAILEILDFLLEFQNKYHTGEPKILRDEKNNIVAIVYNCPNQGSKQMYDDIINSRSFIDKLKIFNIGKILAINFTKITVVVEVIMF